MDTIKLSFSCQALSSTHLIRHWEPKWRRKVVHTSHKHGSSEGGIAELDENPGTFKSRSPLYLRPTYSRDAPQAKSKIFSEIWAALFLEILQTFRKPLQLQIWEWINPHSCFLAFLPQSERSNFKSIRNSPSRRVVTSTWWEGLVLPVIPRAMSAGA
jgi:hypothetical protein